MKPTTKAMRRRIRSEMTLPVVDEFGDAIERLLEAQELAKIFDECELSVRNCGLWAKPS